MMKFNNDGGTYAEYLAANNAGPYLDTFKSEVFRFLEAGIYRMAPEGDVNHQLSILGFEVNLNGLCEETEKEFFTMLAVAFENFNKYRMYTKVEFRGLTATLDYKNSTINENE